MAVGMLHDLDYSDSRCPLVVQLAGQDIDRAVAAEERRAFLLPHCKYCLSVQSSYLISLTPMHSSQTLS